MVNSVNFDKELRMKTEQVNAVISEYLPKKQGFASRIIEAVNYSMTTGGKRIRPILMMESYRLFGGNGKEIHPFMAAMEMIHTHSLIHDDLPAIDNDFYRRGKKTTHAIYGEAMGILSGDALLNYAYETVVKAFDCAGDVSQVVTALKVLAKKTGIHGMLGGQGVDVENEKNEMQALDKEMLDYIYLNKTAALLEGSLMIGGILGGANEEETACLEQIGTKIGLAFQIQDDILDVTSTTEELGKPVFSDEKNHKTTYVTLMGKEEASRRVRSLTEEAAALLRVLPGEKEFLSQLLFYLAFRKK